MNQFPSTRINIELPFSTWSSIISTTKFCQNSTEQSRLNCNDLGSFLFVTIAFNLLTGVSRALSNKRSKLQGICICFRVHLRVISLFSIMDIKHKNITPNFSIFDCPYCLLNSHVSFPSQWWESLDKKTPFDIYPVQP